MSDPTKDPTLEPEKLLDPQTDELSEDELRKVSGGRRAELNPQPLPP